MPSHASASTSSALLDDSKPSAKRKRRSSGSAGAGSGPLDTLDADLYSELCVGSSTVTDAAASPSSSEPGTSRPDQRDEPPCVFQCGNLTTQLQALSSRSWKIDVGYAEGEDRGQYTLRTRGTVHELPFRLDIDIVQQEQSTHFAMHEIELHVSGFVRSELGGMVERYIEHMQLQALLTALDRYARFASRRRAYVAQLAAVFPDLAQPVSSGCIFSNDRGAELIFAFDIAEAEGEDTRPDFKHTIRLTPRLPPDVDIDKQTAQLLASIPHQLCLLLRDRRKIVESVSFVVRAFFGLEL